MKRRFFIQILLLAAASLPAFPQAFTLAVQDEPLSRVLNRLDIDISFDDGALSGYRVTVARPFGSAEQALFYLLGGKPFRVEKIGSVYIIVPGRNSEDREARTETERFVVRGKAVDRASGEPLEYAVVSLFDDDGSRPFVSGVTAGGGRFSIETSRVPKTVKINYMGYETLTVGVGRTGGELGVCELTEAAVVLSEVVVTSESRPPSVSRTSFAVTPQMREGVSNALELLDRIPGVHFDLSTNTVSMNGQSDILLMVDGVQQPYSYLKHLSPDRVQSVNLVYAQSGRFLADDCAGIIQFTLNKDYTGYDVHVASAHSFNLSQKAGAPPWTENYPDAGVSFTTRKFSFYGTYSLVYENLNLFTTQSLTNTVTELESFLPEHPNDLYHGRKHSVTGGLNYQITPLHLAGIQAEFVTGEKNIGQEHAMPQTRPIPFCIRLALSRCGAMYLCSKRETRI
jgi:hypothetical protein